MDLNFLVQVIEWTWTGVAIVGVFVCIWALGDSYIDRAAQKSTHENGGVDLIVKMNLRSAKASTVLHSFFLFLVAFSLLTPSHPFTPVFGLLGLGYILVAATNVRAVGLNQLDRVRLRRS